MLLLRLKLKNFLIFGSVDVDLRDVKLASIIGQYDTDVRRSNGAGKTAFLESIRYALFDQTRSKHKVGIVKIGEKDCTVELEFQIAHRKFRIYRNRTAQGGSAAILWIDGKQAGDKISVVNESIVKYLGIGPDLFDLIYFFKQGDQFGFAEANPSDRKSSLAKVFRMDDLAKCLEVSKEKLKEAERSHQRAKGVADVLRSRISSLPLPQQLQDQRSAISADLANTLQLQANFADFDAECASSFHEFTPKAAEFRNEVKVDVSLIDSLNKQLLEVNRKIGATQAELQKNSSKLAAFESQLSDLKEKVKDAEDLDTQKLQLWRDDIQKKLSDLSAKKNVIDTKIASLKFVDLKNMMGKPCPACRQVVMVDHAESLMKHYNDEKAVFEKELVSIKSQISEKTKELLSGDAILERSRKVNSDKRSYESMQQTVSPMRSVVAKNQKEIEELEAVRSKLCVEIAAVVSRANVDFTSSYIRFIDDLEGKIAKADSYTRTRRLFLESEIRKMSVEENTIENLIKNREEIGVQLDTAIQNESQNQNAVAVFETLVDVFGKNGIQAVVIDNAIGVIEKFANDILSQMQTKFKIALKTLKENKSGEVRESLDIIVSDNGDEKPFESYSGGERTIINIAIRLSLSRVIGSLHGIELHSLFLDEVLGALDEVNREEVVKIISYLSKKFEQVFIISHTNEIKDIIDTSILIKRYDTHACVVMN